MLALSFSQVSCNAFWELSESIKLVLLGPEELFWPRPLCGGWLITERRVTSCYSCEQVQLGAN